MSTSRGSGTGNGGGMQSIPAGARKIVQSLKEIVSYSEADIYATLKDCNMDPNEAVSRLLAQDPFHEVKSKREKKKEGKDIAEPRPRAANHNSSRGSKISTDRYISHGGSARHESSEYAGLLGKASHKKESVSAPYTSSFSTTGISGNNSSRGPVGLSNDATTENKGSSLGMADAVPSDAHRFSGNQSFWTEPPGPVSMADIVKMGRPQNNASNTPNNSIPGPSTSDLHQNHRFPEAHESRNQDSGISMVQHSPTNDEWLSMEKPVNTEVYVPDYIVDSEQHQDAHGVPVNCSNQPSEVKDVQEVEDEDANYSGVSDSIYSRKIIEDDSRAASQFENDLYKDIGSYQHDLDEAEENDASVSSGTRNLQHLNIEKDNRGLPPEGYAPSVVIPDHLQVQDVDCSHLSFGSFGPKLSLPAKSNLENPHNKAGVFSVGHLNNRGSEYYVDDSLTNASDGSLFHRSSTNTETYAPSSASQREGLKPENAEAVHGNQYSYSPNPGYTFSDAQHLNGSFTRESSQMQNLASISNVMGYSNSLPNHHSGRKSDLLFSQFANEPSFSAKYGNPVSAVGSSAISMSEALNTATGFSSLQPSAPPMLSMAGPSPPNHLSIHPYPQAALHLGPYANMMGYPYLPQNYTYMPSSAFQQTFGANSMYHHQSRVESMLPRYKNSVSGASLTQLASEYSGLGNIKSIPRNVSMGPSRMSLGYNDVLSSRFNDSSRLDSPQQNDSSGMRLHGLNSRTMSALPASSTYYNYQQGQNQQTGGGFRQAQQQPSQNYATYGYPNFQHSQGGALFVEQLQNPRDGSLGGSQGQPKQSQNWQGGY